MFVHSTGHADIQTTTAYPLSGEHDDLVHPWEVGTRDTLVYRIVDGPTPREGQSS